MGQSGSKKQKNAFYKCVLESHFIYIAGLGGSILSKKSKSLYPLCEYLQQPRGRIFRYFHESEPAEGPECSASTGARQRRRETAAPQKRGRLSMT